MKKVTYVFCFVLVLAVAPAFAASISMNGSDTLGQSSFNSGVHWTGGAAPSAGNDYFVPSAYRLRTPANAGSYTFAGDSLTIQHGVGTADNGFCYKGTDTAGTSQITVGNLILDNGQIVHINGSTQIFNLYGNINVASASNIYAKQGPINVYSTISGSATITNPGSDGDGRTLTFYSSANTFTGSVVNKGRFVLADDAILNFVIGASGVNNSVSGTGASTVFGGDFIFDLLGAGTTLGDSWTIASAASQTFGGTFTVAGFTDLGSDKWLKSANGVNYQFDESTGMLSVVPEPATMILLGLGGLLVSRKKR